MTQQNDDSGKKRDEFRRIVFFVYLLFMVFWFLFLFVVFESFDVSVAEGMGLGTATGVFLGSFKDMWQFIWRKS